RAATPPAPSRSDRTRTTGEARIVTARAGRSAAPTRERPTAPVSRDSRAPREARDQALHALGARGHGDSVSRIGWAVRRRAEGAWREGSVSVGGRPRQA